MGLRLIIAGSRTITDYEILETCFSLSCFELSDIDEIVSGCAKGVDTLGELFAYNHDIPIQHFPADWATYGRGAGHMRNAEMAAYANAALLLMLGKSKGTLNMNNTAIKYNLTTDLFEVDEWKHS